MVSRLLVQEVFQKVTLGATLIAVARYADRDKSDNLVV